MSTEYLTSVNNRDIKSDVDLKKVIFTLTKKLKRKKLTCCIKLDSVKQYKKHQQSPWRSRCTRWWRNRRWCGRGTWSRYTKNQQVYFYKRLRDIIYVSIFQWLRQVENKKIFTSGNIVSNISFIPCCCWSWNTRWSRRRGWCCRVTWGWSAD